jgi:phosphoribosylformylglycinamidine synthase
MATGAVVGIQDMGAAGLTCSTCEMGARGELGLTIELDLVPQRATGMTAYEIMLSESQERMLLVADKGREGEVLAVFAKWGLDASIVGIVTADDTMRVTHHGELVAEIPNKALTDEAPVYHRPVGTWNSPVPLDPPAWVVEELKKPRDYTADLKKLLASANICDKRWVFEQYDSMVQSNTVQGPGGEAGVMRIKSSSGGTGDGKPERGLAMALAGNGRWCWLDPKLGAMHAVAEAARKVACTGAVPVAATNCLNFGNPEKPEIMAQFSATIDGISEACTALGTPITGGNVSFYNETRGEGIYPTPVVGVVGILEDVSKAVPAAFQKAGDAILLLTLPVGTTGTRPDREFGSTEFAKTILQTQWGTPPCMQLLEEFELHNALQALAKRGLIHSASDVSDGGLAVALARACIPNNVGVRISLHPQFPFEKSGVRDLFGEDSSLALVTCDPSNVDVLKQVVDEFGFVFPMNLGETIEPSKSVEADFEISFPGRGSAVSTTLSELRAAYATTLESQLAAEVVTG